MLPIKIFQKKIKAWDLFLLEPEVVTQNVIICCKLKENNTRIRSTALKLNREATVCRKFNLKDWFATKQYPQRIS